MDSELEGTTIESCIGTFEPVVDSYTPINVVAHRCPSIVCPFCGYDSGQFCLEYVGGYRNYCPSCELTWHYRLERRPIE